MCHFKGIRSTWRRLAAGVVAALLFTSPSPLLFAQITFTEVMFDPAGPESSDEFVEILNLSGTDSVDLSGWWFSDGRAVDSLHDAGNGLVLAPGQYALILDPSYFGKSTSYDALIPQGALVLTLDNATFGSGGLSNSVARTLVLGDAAGDTASVYTYSLGNAPGHSDEKIDPTGANTPENWADSRVFNGTPGGPNSVTPPEVDLALGPAAPRWQPERPRQGDIVEIEMEVSNFGLRPVPGYRLSLYDDADRDSVVSDAELVRSVEAGPLSPGATQRLFLEWDRPDAGGHSLLARLEADGDLRAENDTLWFQLMIGFPPAALVINEFMYRPFSGDPEWVELFNPGPKAIDLRGWRLSDADVDRPISLTEEMLTVAAGSYQVVASAVPLSAAFAGRSDSVLVPSGRFPTLNNTEDEIVLFDPLGFTIDSVAYTSSWGKETGRSLEKIWFERSGTDPGNWAASRDSLGATPARLNSVSPRSFDVAVRASEILFSPEQPAAGEAILLTVPVRNLGRLAVDGVEVIVFDDRDGDLRPDPQEELARRSLTQPLESDELENVEFDLGSLSSGWHLLLIEVRLPADQRIENNLAKVELAVGYSALAVVVNEVMFDPQTGQSEWVELYNRSPEAVDLRNWQLGDATGTAPLPQRSLRLPAGGFAVLAPDSSVLGRYGGFEGLLVTFRNFPALNNNADRVEICDMHGFRIDAMAYRGAWGAGPGISLERLHPDLASDDSTTWYPSVAPAGATPGRVNSIFIQVKPATTTLEVHPNPFSPDGDGVEDFVVVSFRLPQPTASVNLKIYDMRGRLVRQLLNNAATGAERQVVWDGLNGRGEPLPTGIYIVYLQAIRPQSGFLRAVKKTVVLAR